MGEPSQHINYSFEDIQRYLQGKMSATEMHDMEKAALQDPFLADAIEGFNEADFTVAKQHLNEINAGLFAEKKDNKVVAFNKRTQWLNIAAVVIVLAAIGLVTSYFFRSPSDNRQTNIAKAPQAAAKSKIIKDSAVTENSGTLAKQADSGLFMAQNKAIKKTQPSSAKSKNREIFYKKTGAETSGVATVAALPSLNYTPTPPVTDTVGYVFEPNKPFDTEKTMVSRSYNDGFAAFDKADSNPVALQGTLQGRVAGLSVSPSPAGFTGIVKDQNGNPVPYTMIQSADKRTSLIADADGVFNIQQKDSLLNVTASTVGFNPQQFTLKKGIYNSIVLSEPQESSLSEVVITAMGTKKKKNARNTLSRNREIAAADSATPVGGWNNFNHYVVTQLNKDTTSAAIDNLEDIVEIEFLVDKAGNPTDIKVTKSPNEQYSSKAVEILKNGPKWTKPDKKKKAKVVINF